MEANAAGVQVTEVGRGWPPAPWGAGGVQEPLQVQEQASDLTCLRLEKNCPGCNGEKKTVGAKVEAGRPAGG